MANAGLAGGAVLFIRMKSRCEPVIAIPIPRGDTGPVADNIVRTWLKRRRRENEQWRHDVAAQHLHSVNQLANLGDAELIASSPSIQNVTHQMEMDRRLKVAIVDLTTETIAAAGHRTEQQDGSSG